MTTYDMANERIAEDIANNKVDATNDNANANNYAKNIMKSYEEESGNPMYNTPAPPQRPAPPTAPNMPRELAQHHASMETQSSLAQQYQPPVPPSQQPEMPQQSQHITAPLRQQTGDYTGFDATDKLSPLDSGFNAVKEPVRQRANLHSDPRMNDNVEPYAVEEMFSSF